MLMQEVFDLLKRASALRQLDGGEMNGVVASQEAYRLRLSNGCVVHFAWSWSRRALPTRKRRASASPLHRAA
jgi:hypothetical protein